MTDRKNEEEPKMPPTPANENWSRQVYTDDNDIHDSKEDEEKLKPDTTTIDLPDVEDIPGQENVHVPPLGELRDTTISSDDEEGKGIFGDE